MIDKGKLQAGLGNATGCYIQHNGWTCGTCFFALSDKLDNSDWNLVLFIRGDYTEKELTNIPKDREKSYKKIMKIIEEHIGDTFFVYCDKCDGEIHYEDLNDNEKEEYKEHGKFTCSSCIEEEMEE